MNNGWIFIIFGAILAGLALWVGIFKKPFLIHLPAILTILSLILLAYGGYLIAKPKTFLTGTLETVIVNPDENFTVNIGSNRYITDYAGLVKGFDMRRFIDYGEEYPIKIKLDEGKLLITAWITDREGNMVAHIIDNDWEINPNNFYDRNFSNSAIEVIDRDKTPVLQIVIESGNNIYIGGVFYYPRGKVVLTHEGMYINPTEKIKIQRLFKYPADKYLGVLDQ